MIRLRVTITTRFSLVNRCCLFCLCTEPGTARNSQGQEQRDDAGGKPPGPPGRRTAPSYPPTRNLVIPGAWITLGFWLPVTVLPLHRPRACVDRTARAWIGAPLWRPVEAARSRQAGRPSCDRGCSGLEGYGSAWSGSHLEVVRQGHGDQAIDGHAEQLGMSGRSRLELGRKPKG